MLASKQIAFGKGGGEKPEPSAYWGLCFTAEEDGSVVAMEAVGDAPAVSLETSYDGEIWEPFYVGETSITLNKGERIYFKAGEGGNTAFATSTSKYNKFSLSTGKIAASGDIMSLLNGDVTSDTIPATYCFCYLFGDCTSLISAPELPATTLVAYCYGFMFYGCTSLATVPELPAETIASSCYRYMFNGCTSLVSTQTKLPATGLKNYCYQSMFANCSSLVTTMEELPSTNLILNCYTSMFENCALLVTAPKILASVGSAFACNAMFRGCGSLSDITIAVTTFSSNRFTNWVNGVSPTGTFRCPSALGTNETIVRGVSACPEGWTVINTD